MTTQQTITVDVIRRRVYEAIPGNDNWRSGDHDMQHQFGTWGLNFCDILLTRIAELEDEIMSFEKVNGEDIRPISASEARVSVSYEVFEIARTLVQEIAEDAVIIPTDSDILLSLGETCKKDDPDDPRAELYWLLHAAQAAGYDYLVVRD